MDATHPNTAPRVLDEVMYLAGLASDREVINPWLETVRAVTANHTDGQPFSNQEQGKLQEVRTRLVTHLTHDDALRTFTETSLQDKINDQFHDTSNAHVSPLKRVQRQFRLILVAAGTTYAVAAIVFFMLGVPGWFLFAASCTITTTFISSCWLFLSGYSTFTPTLRRAYTWVCAGIVVLGVGASTWMLFTTVPAVYAVPFFHAGGNFAIFAVAFAVAHQGLRVLAITLKVQSRFLSWGWLLAVAAIYGVGTLALTQLAHSEPSVASTLVINSIITVLGLCTADLAVRVSKALTPGYARAVRLFGFGYGWSGVVGIVFNVLALIYGISFGIPLMIIGLFYAAGGIIIFFSGYKFRLSSIGE